MPGAGSSASAAATQTGGVAKPPKFIKCGIANCETCTNLQGCDKFQHGFILFEKTCVISHPLAEPLKSLASYRTSPGCTLECYDCLSGVCFRCNRNYEINTDRTCTKICQHLDLNQACVDQTAQRCGVTGQKMRCNCGAAAQHCMTCKISTAAPIQCQTCLPGYVLEGGSCERCAQTFVRYASYCIPEDLCPGTGSQSTLSCSEIVVMCVIILICLIGAAISCVEKRLQTAASSRKTIIYTQPWQDYE
ncbi:Cysteine-rich membrane protein 2 [Spironucleus salmonicida]|uniref:Cysteine-rich membrane protein 2 n=2 Tax=Spironucleus salmonicida TaxID=348837 RepID=V6M0T4_9EUKA|nr:Cysteine-rich membrane protein 2 [Spironucleus salmonicida]KAH0571884.1 Cysteine-rich membrane protein 2 [Spironucleus salmonicida]|eukprot:EST46744.1 Cysteine-rich membrane protein 2 [Spironucleus salmonicida]